MYIYNKTSIKRNILTKKIHREVGRAKNLSAPQVHKSRRSKKTFFGLHHPEDEATTILRNDANYTTNETA